MKWTKLMMGALTVALFVGVGVGTIQASDHDDGEMDLKGRALNLTDHYAWVDDNDSTLMNIVQSSNPRSLPGQQYYFSAKARYEMHVSRVSSNASQPSGKSDVVYRFEFGAPDQNNIQPVTMTVIDGDSVGSDSSGKTTNLVQSRSGSLTLNTATINGITYKYFAGLREDTFHFDVERFFQVRNFLVDTFVRHNGNGLAKTCDGQALAVGGANLFNPPSCAPDFTKNYNVNQIALQVNINDLGKGAKTFDTWSIITVPQQ